jgi:hypothetical protein
MRTAARAVNVTNPTWRESRKVPAMLVHGLAVFVVPLERIAVRLCGELADGGRKLRVIVGKVKLRLTRRIDPDPAGESDNLSRKMRGSGYRMVRHLSIFHHRPRKCMERE